LAVFLGQLQSPLPPWMVPGNVQPPLQQLAGLPLQSPFFGRQHTPAGQTEVLQHSLSQLQNCPRPRKQMLTPQTFGVNAPQDWLHGQLAPQFSRLPQPSGIVPQFLPCRAHEVGVQQTSAEEHACPGAQQTVPQPTDVGLQEKPHKPALQVANALSGAVQGVHEVPHEAGLLFDTQLPLQSWNSELQT